MEASLEQPVNQEEVANGERLENSIAFKSIVQGYLLEKIIGSASENVKNTKEKRKELLDKALKFGEWFEKEVIQGTRFDTKFLDIFKKDKQSAIKSIREEFSDGWDLSDIEEGTPIREFINVVGFTYMPELFSESVTETSNVKKFERTIRGTQKKKEESVPFKKVA